eukprot:TRINITY_DN4958_c0_g1_i3.p1 TRINITY_DN4958_c0_g1~~TRINITY_DN4958_c0_g1_i3.p1  ORF type:complete len:164 (-),score=64.74 TRINITY_DN4958_c0_g1_i3:53-544(-)
MDSDDEGDWAKAAEAEAAESKRMSEKTPLLSPGAQQGSPVPQHMVAQQQQQMAFATVSADNKIIAERNKEFQGLAEDIVVLRDAAEDMSQLVGTQGEDLKHVKESTTHAVDDVEEGATQLKQAYEYACWARYKKVFCIIIAVIAFIVVVAIVFGVLAALGVFD